LQRAEGWGHIWLPGEGRNTPMLVAALSTGGIIALAIAIVILIVLFFVILRRARRG
jgi:hypothetical protein